MKTITRADINDAARKSFSLASLTIHMWHITKQDADAAIVVQKEYDTTPDAVIVRKTLLTGATTEWRAVLSASERLRKTFRKLTKPYGGDSGMRMLSNSNMIKIMEDIGREKEEFMKAVDTFVDAYPECVKKAKKELKGLANDDDYPTPDVVRSRFSVDMDVIPMPTGQDFGEVPDAMIKRLQQQVEGRLNDHVMLAMRTAQLDILKHLRVLSERLSQQPEEGKRRAPISESMLESVKLSATLLQQFSIIKDKKLKKIIKEISKLMDIDIRLIRKSDDVKVTMVEIADNLIKRLNKYQVPTVK